MKTAIAAWNNRVAPVFDSAKTFIVVDCVETQIVHEQTISLPPSGGGSAADFFINAGVRRIVCGAISGESEDLLLRNGIEIYPFVAGFIEEVVDAIRKETLESRRFSMPGCACPRRRCRRGGSERCNN